jgi:superfamily I DNA/RNA helicase
MKFNELPGAHFSCKVRFLYGETARTLGTTVEKIMISETPGEFKLFTKDSIVVVTPQEERDIDNLIGQLSSGRSYLSELGDMATNDIIDLKICFFFGEVQDFDDFEVAIDEIVLNNKAFSKARQKNSTPEDILRNCINTLDSNFTYKSGENFYFFIAAGPSLDDYLGFENDEIVEPSELGTDGKEGDEEHSNSDESSSSLNVGSVPRITSTIDNSFAAIGKSLKFVATKTSVQGKDIFIPNKLTRIVRGDNKGKILLCKGRLTFKNWTDSEISKLSAAHLNELIKEKSAYLNKWDEFGNLEGEILLEQARKFGALEYSDVTPRKDGTVEVTLSNFSSSARELIDSGGVEAVEIANSLPLYLEDEDLKFPEYCKSLLDSQANSSNKISCKINKINFESRKIVLDVENIPSGKKLILSLQGEVAQIKRREQARRSITTGHSANPQLGALIEEGGQIVSLRSPQQIKPLTDFVKTKIFKNPPTVRQVEAVEVALNTPDIALIQGPPGTGKTTVIAAILERLNEMAAKDGKNLKGQILLTGFQHDAVENMIDRISLNSLPVPKFGGKRGGGNSEDEMSEFEQKLERWCSNIVDSLLEKYPEISKSQNFSEVERLLAQYSTVPTRSLGLQIVESILEQDLSNVDEISVKKLNRIYKRLVTYNVLNSEENDFLKYVRTIRTKVESFNDDGPQMAYETINKLSSYVEDNEKAILSKASEAITPISNSNILEELKQLKRKLLVKFSTPPDFRVEKPSGELIAVVSSIIEQIKNYSKGNIKDRGINAIAKFASELTNNPSAMIDAISDYSYAFAATCQQSVNTQMQKQKGIKGNDTDLEYDYVIVDEAARVSPRDLMIPMAQGKKIILVGDHRQLPHIIDEEVARQMEENEDVDSEIDDKIDKNDQQDWLKKSMFQYLFSERLKQLEQNDGIKRRVTLDTQFRMHPLLGDFISKNFYETFDLSEKFSSGLPSSVFSHSLKGIENKAAVWLDVPVNQGKHSRKGTSWVRQAEIDAIVEKINKWSTSEDGQNLTFGVISFYKAQADEIRRKLGKLGTDEANIKVGTVDSFQGMEFDIVFLSVVRTVASNLDPNISDRESAARRAFGHLCLYNRLNVSMSRQKKTLIAVGDSQLVKNPLAQEFIPGLVDFYGVCSHDREGAIING